MAVSQIDQKIEKVSKIYTNEEAFNSALKYFKGDELAARVWVNKYALKDSDGNIYELNVITSYSIHYTKLYENKYALKDSDGNIYELNPDDMHRRLASEIARIEKLYPNPMSEEELFELFKDFTYIVPQGGPMAGIGNRFQIASLSNCFVIGNDGNSDSYGGIMKIDQEQVQLMKRRA